MRLLTGYKRRPTRRALREYHHHVNGVVPVASSLASFAPAIMDQGQTSSCVGHARAAGLYIAAGAAGAPLGFVPSPGGLYTVARCVERNWGQPLEDTGCDPMDSMTGAATWGIRPLGPPAADGRYSDVSPVTVNDPPELGSLLKGLVNRVTNDAQITDVGQARVDAVVAAIAGGRPVCIDVCAGTDAWQGYTGTTVLTAQGQPTDHYVVLVGYDGKVIYGRNSWGSAWGSAGTFMIDDTVLAEAGDLIVCGY